MSEYLDFISIDFWHIVMSMGNLIILTFILKKFLFDPVQDILKKREQQIKAEYDKAEQALSEAQKDKKEYMEKLRKAENESDMIIKNAVSRARDQEDLIIGTAKKKAEALIKKAECDIEDKKKRALVGMRDEISNMVIDTAGKIIDRELTEETHRDLINVAIDELCEG